MNNQDQMKSMDNSIVNRINSLKDESLISRKLSSEIYKTEMKS